MRRGRLGERAARSLALALWLGAGACTSELVVDIQPLAPDAGQDAQAPGPAPDAGQDADTPRPDAGGSEPDARPPVESDAGESPAPDAAPPDDGPIIVLQPLDAGSDAAACDDASCGCGDAACDAGVLPGPCFSCDVVVLIGPADCPNGSPTVCWNNPDGECTMQCPDVASCSAGDATACAADEYCYFPKHDCGASSMGYCAKRPLSCSDIDAPACGCDGMTYRNGCVANQAGTTRPDPEFAKCN